MRAVKSLQFGYQAPASELASLFEDFRLMCNDAIRIALKEKPKSKFNLTELSYSRLKEYGLHTHYILSACEVAYSIYRNKNRKSSNPCVSRAFLKLDNQSYLLNHLILRIPVTARHFIYLTLKGSRYHLSLLNDPTLKKGSVTVTPEKAVISLSKKNVEETPPLGHVGVDVNERNVTIAAPNGHIKQFTELGEVADIKEQYREIRAKIGSRTRGDRRISSKLYKRYGQRERNRTVQRIHKISKAIVSYAKANGFGIKLEKLTGIRKLYRKGNRQGSSFRGRMNSWIYHETQRQIEYKGRWNGLFVSYVNPRGTSRNCPDCGSRVVPSKEDRKLYCPRCDMTWDRDVLASKNIMVAPLVRANRPLRGSGEGESKRQEAVGNPRSRWVEVT
jgi:putative transposase